MEQKKNYEMPVTETIEVKVNAQLLAGSPTGPADEIDGAREFDVVE